MFDHGARCSMDGLRQDVPATMKRCPARCRAQPAGSWRSPFEEIASSITTQSTDLWGQRSLPKKKRLLHLLSSPGRAMRLCSADLLPQALMRARCPRSLVMNRRCEAASPYLSKLGARCSKDGLGQDVPATMKTWANRPCSASSSLSSTSMFNVGCSMFNVHFHPLHLAA